jgi:hypothetical protein
MADGVPAWAAWFDDSLVAAMMARGMNAIPFYGCGTAWGAMMS